MVVTSQDWILARLSGAIVARFPAYAPGSRGRLSTLAEMTLETINRVPGDLANVADFAGRSIPVIALADWLNGELSRGERLESLLNHYGSDKVRHGYHRIYAQILGKKDSINKILEIGLGTNNQDVISNMSTAGKPGASLRAFRDYCENARVYGADVDSRILFEDERISTYYVNQLDSYTLQKLSIDVAQDFDLVIDDGLHAPDANIATLLFGLTVIKPGGWVVIEDIKPEAESFWKVVAGLLPEGFEISIIRANFALVFAVHRVD